MSELAQRLGLAKGTLYLYFETKEELFLVLLESMLETWLAELTERLKRVEPPASPQEMARLLYESLRFRQPMIRLSPMTHHFAGNVLDEEELAAFDRRLLGYLKPAATAVEQCLPGLRPGWGLRFMLHARAVTIGTFQRADKPALARKVASENPDLESFDITFEREFLFAMEALLRGLLEMSGEGESAS